jgi:hypothetical protein
MIVDVQNRYCEILDPKFNFFLIEVETKEGKIIFSQEVRPESNKVVLDDFILDFLKKPKLERVGFYIVFYAKHKSGFEKIFNITQLTNITNKPFIVESQGEPFP